MANNQIRLSLNSSIKGNEAYEIKATPKVLMLSGSTPAGVFYGLQTFTKALPNSKNVKQVDVAFCYGFQILHALFIVLF